MGISYHKIVRNYRSIGKAIGFEQKYGIQEEK